MLSLREESKSRTCELTVNGIVRREALSDLLLRLAPATDGSGPGGLLLWVVSFGGVTTEGLWLQVGRCLEQVGFVGRVAVVADERWTETFERDDLPGVEQLRFFAPPCLEDARAWVRG